jgi:hypothetical protein
MPNRDTYLSGVNSGAVMVYDLHLLSLHFDQRAFRAVEGSEGAVLSIVRDTVDASLVFRVRRSRCHEIHDHV